MGFDRGVDAVVASGSSEDRSKEYVDALNAKISFLKKEIAALAKESEALRGKKNIEEMALKLFIEQSDEIRAGVDKEISYKKKEVDSLGILADKFVESNKLSADKFESNMKKMVADEKEQIDALKQSKGAIEKEVRDLIARKEVAAKDVALLEDQALTLRELNKSLSGLNESLDKKKSEKEAVVEVVERSAEEIEQKVEQKKEEFKKLQASASAMAEERQKIKDMLNEVERDRFLLNKEREEATKKAKDLSNMANELKVEAQALANKNAILNKREATLKEAQKSI